MEDRIVEYPHRYRIVPVEGEDNVVDLIPMPGKITAEGTPLEKEMLLSDETGGICGLPAAEATVNNAIKKLCQQKAQVFLGAITTTGASDAPAGDRLVGTVTFDVPVKMVIIGLANYNQSMYHEGFPVVLSPTGEKSAFLEPNGGVNKAQLAADGLSLNFYVDVFYSDKHYHGDGPRKINYVAFY